MANQIVQLKNGSNDVFPNVYHGTFIPKLYDLDRYVCDLPQAGYFRIGGFGVAFLPGSFGQIIQEHLSEIETMVQIRNFPFLVYGGTLYLVKKENPIYSVQGSNNRLYIRPNINKETSIEFGELDQICAFGVF